MQQNVKVLLIRGLPGSGKTTMAKKMEGFVHFEADMFLEVDGVYIYDSSKVRSAHDWCLESTKAALERGDKVVVSNTFTKAWEIQPYVDLGFPFEVIEATGNWESIHGVPVEKIDLMRARWEPLPEILENLQIKK